VTGITVSSRKRHTIRAPTQKRGTEGAAFRFFSLSRHSGAMRSIEPQVRNCAPGNLEIPGSSCGRPGMIE
jgi:hypothetical protein